MRFDNLSNDNSSSLSSSLITLPLLSLLSLTSSLLPLTHLFSLAPSLLFSPLFSSHKKHKTTKQGKFWYPNKEDTLPDFVGKLQLDIRVLDEVANLLRKNYGDIPSFRMSVELASVPNPNSLIFFFDFFDFFLFFFFCFLIFFLFACLWVIVIYLFFVCL